MRQSGFCVIQIMISQIELHEADLKAMMERIPNSSPDKTYYVIDIYVLRGANK